MAGALYTKPPVTSLRTVLCTFISLATSLSGLKVRWIAGSMDRWFSGSMDRWFNGFKDRWLDGLMDRRFDGSLVRWFDGSLVRFFDGSLVRWFDGPMNVRIVHLGLHDAFCRVSIFLVLLIIPIPVVNSWNIPKTWQDFIQNGIASFSSSSAKHCFSNVFYPSAGGHVGDPEAYRIPPVILWNPLVQTQCDLACPYCRPTLRTWRWNDGTMEQVPIRCLAVYSLSRSESFLWLVCISVAILTKLLHMTPSC